MLVVVEVMVVGYGVGMAVNGYKWCCERVTMLCGVIKGVLVLV